MNARKRKQSPQTTPETDDIAETVRASKKARTIYPHETRQYTENALERTRERVKGDKNELRALSSTDLLLIVPALLMTPPNHPDYPRSLHYSLLAARECLRLPALEVGVECRAWRNLAEAGMRIIEAGYSGSVNTEPVYDWAAGIEPEVEKAISKALLLSQKHPSLSQQRYHLTLLSARFAQCQRNHKFAISLLKRLLSSIRPTTADSDVYYAHLFYISLLLNQNTKLSQAQVVSAITTLQTEATRRKHPYVALLARFLHLRTLVQMGIWTDVKILADEMEETFGIAAYYPKEKGKEKLEAQEPVTPPQLPSYPDPFVAAVAAHVLILLTLYYTHIGDAAEATKRLGCLHALLDTHGEDMGFNGSLEVSLSDTFSISERKKGQPSLTILSTHSRVLTLLVYLVTAVAKRDPVGRKPKRKVFAEEGMAVCATMWEKGVEFLPWAGTSQVQEIEERVAKIKADLMCEMLGVSIMRSEFDLADKTFNELVAHTRTNNLFDEYAPRITLYQAHIAQAIGDIERAMICYRVVAGMAKDEFIRVAGLAGEVTLRLGIQALDPDDDDDEEAEEEKEETLQIEKKAREVVRLCHELGGTMKAVAEVIEACLCKELVKARQHLKTALAITSSSQDNYLRALILALIAAYFFHTSEGHSVSMLNACDNLASGLGAQEKSKSKSSDKAKGGEGMSLGHARLRLWIGETILELHRRAGAEELVAKQMTLNMKLEEQVKKLESRRISINAE